MKRARNWYAVGGVLLGIAGVVAYFLIILTYHPTLHRWLEWPVVHLAAVALGLIFSGMGVARALAGTHRGRVLAPVLAALNFAVAGLFAWWMFAYSYRLPVAARAPAVGAAAPDFTLQDERGNAVTLSSLRGQPVVLLFYRGFW